MKKLLILLSLTGCATTSQVDQLQEKLDLTQRRIETVRLEQQVQFCAVSLFPCLLTTKDQAFCMSSAYECATEAVVVFKAKQPEGSVPDETQQVIENLKRLVKTRK